MSHRITNKINRFLSAVILAGMYATYKITHMGSFQKCILVIGIAAILISHFVFKLDRKIRVRLFYEYKIYKKGKETDNIINDLKNMKNYSDYMYLYGTIETAFKKLYRAIENSNIEICKPYFSEEELSRIHDKIMYYSTYGEQITYKKIELLKINPISVIHNAQCIDDVVWVNIKYRYESHIKDEVNMTSVSLKKGNICSNEFWKLINKRNGQWIVTRILKSEDYDYAEIVGAVWNY